MIRIAASLLIVFLAGGGAKAGTDALLRPRVLVEGDSVTLGDLFDNAGERAGLVVMKAPLPGRRIALDSDWLAHVALVNGLRWHPRDLFEDAVVERAGKTIAAQQLAEAVRAALTHSGAPEDSAVEFDAPGTPLVVASAATPKVGVRDLFYDRDRQRFSATVTVTDATSALELARQAVGGQVFATVSVPVLAQSLGRGEIIAARDLAWIRLRPERLRAATITDADQLIGMTAKQNLRAGQPLAVTDVQKPLAVQRGALVTLLLNHGGMALTAQGRADDQGSLGDVIRVTNTHSNQSVTGTIVAPNQVRVSLTGAIALAN